MILKTRYSIQIIADSLLINYNEIPADWTKQVEYIVELGRSIPAGKIADREDKYKVQGCVSQVWMQTWNEEGYQQFKMDSDSMIVKGLIGLILRLYDDQQPKDIKEFDIFGMFDKMGLNEHLSKQRSNGLRNLINNIYNTI